MALFFNIEYLEKEAANDAVRFLALLRNYYIGVLPKNSKDRNVADRRKMAGHGFILCPAPIFESTRIDIAYRVQYVMLAARRDYSLYKLYRYTALDLSYFPDIDLEKIKHNPLLKIEGKHLYFKYEELYTKRKI